MRIDGNDLDPETLEDITTPMLALERRDAENVVELHTEREAFLPTFDLGLDIPLPATEQRVHTRSFLDRDGQAYFMATMQPQFEIGSDDRPVHYAFVLDRSHSTSPELWTTARGVVEAMTEIMDENDRFTVLACDSACDRNTGGLQAPASAVVERVQAFLDGQDLAGASDVASSLLEAQEALRQAGGERTTGDRLSGRRRPNLGRNGSRWHSLHAQGVIVDTRLLAVALGARADLTTLQAAVDVTGGDLIPADAHDDLRALVRELRLRVEVPALRDARLELPAGMEMARIQNVSAIRPGDSVVVTGNSATEFKARSPCVDEGQRARSRFPCRSSWQPRARARRPSTPIFHGLGRTCRSNTSPKRKGLRHARKSWPCRATTPCSRGTPRCSCSRTTRCFASSTWCATQKETNTWNGELESKTRLSRIGNRTGKAKHDKNADKDAGEALPATADKPVESAGGDSRPQSAPQAEPPTDEQGFEDAEPSRDNNKADPREESLEDVVAEEEVDSGPRVLRHPGEAAAVRDKARPVPQLQSNPLQNRKRGNAKARCTTTTRSQDSVEGVRLHRAPQRSHVGMSDAASFVRRSR